MKIESFFEATTSYETWLGRALPIIKTDLALKHEHMAESSFMFLRATFYRWMQNWNMACGDLDRETAKVLAVGDLHIENFGTWRDADGRLIWGINDFDEAYPMSYAIDLVRLATSAWIASKAGAFKVANDDVITAILAGYERGIRKGGCAYVLEEHHVWLRDLAMSELREPSRFWEKVTQLPKAPKSATLKSASKKLLKSLPEHSDAKPLLLSRIAGLGSLGRPRFVALAQSGGSYVCREAKAVAPSACAWAIGKKSAPSYIEDILKRAHRVRDPFYGAQGGWLVRRLAPHCSKIDMSHLPKKRDDLALLESMGVEIANMHLGSKHSSDIKRDFTPKRRKQISAAIARMNSLTLSDWNEWRTDERWKIK